MSAITITDQMNPGVTVTVDRGDALEALRDWFPKAPGEIREALTGLQSQLNRHEPTHETEEYLGIRITY